MYRGLRAALVAGDRRRRVVGAADRAPAARGDRTRRNIVDGSAETRPVEPDDLDRNGSQPGDRAGRHPARGAHRRNRRAGRDADGYPPPQRLRFLLRHAALACGAGGGTRMAATLRAVEPALENARRRAAAGQSKSTLLTRGTHPGPWRPVRTARVPDAARGTSNAASGADRGRPVRRRRAFEGDAHERVALDDGAPSWRCGALLRIVPGKLRHPRPAWHSR